MTLDDPIDDIIVPPPEIRAVVNKTSQFVAKNGRQFESRILSSSEGSTPKFSFMSPTSPYHPYYQSRISFFQDGGDAGEEEREIQRKREEDEAAHKEANEKKEVVETVVEESTEMKAAVDVVGRAVLEARRIMEEDRKRKNGEEKKEEGGDEEEGKEEVAITPDPILFATVHPPPTATPLEIDAMKLAAQFTASCGRGFMIGLGRKEGNNPLFEFLKPSSSNFAYFTALVDSYQKVLRPGEKEIERVLKLSTVGGMVECAAMRKEYRREMSIRRAEEEGRDGGEGVAMINWHDFVIVETIEFREEKEVEEEGMDMEESDEEEEQVVEEEGDIKVVKDYKARVATTGDDKGDGTMVDPITGERVRISEMSEHMRIQLMDPKWREQNKRFQSKLGNTNVASGESIVANLKAFSEERKDIFGSSVDREMERRMEEKERGEEAQRILEKYKDKGAKEVATVAPPPPQGMAAQPQGMQPQGMMQPPPRGMQPPPRGIPPAPPQQQPGQPRDSGRRGVSNLPAWMKNQPGVLPNPTTVVASSAGEQIETLKGRASILGGRSREDVEVMEGRDEKRQKVEETPAMGEGPIMGQAPAAPPMPAPAEETIPDAAPDAAEAFPGGIMPPDVFVASLESPTISLSVNCPVDESANGKKWGLDGKTVTVSLDVNDTVKNIKASLSKELGMPQNKMQLKGKDGFLKDAHSLAHLNLRSGAGITLVAKTRGGGRK